MFLVDMKEKYVKIRVDKFEMPVSKFQKNLGTFPHRFF